MLTRAKVTALFAIVLFITLFGFLFYQSNITGYAVVEGDANAVGISLLKIKITGSDDLNQNYTGMQSVEFYDITTPIAKFDWNFSQGPLNLSQVSIESVAGELAFNGINVPKTLFVERGDNTHVCILDDAGRSILDFTGICMKEDEKLIPCDGELHDGYNCSVFSDLFMVSGLMHSAIKAMKVAGAPEEQPEQPAVTEIRDESNRLVGTKITDEPGFETHFALVEKTSEALNLMFYHDAATSQPVWIEGTVNYTLSHAVAMPYENITLSVLLVQGIVPKFKVHVGAASEIFEFGKEIPDVSFEGNYTLIDRNDSLLDVELTTEDSSALIKGTNESSITAKINGVPDSEITTPVFASEEISMEEAVITLPKNSAVNAILECPDFDVNTFTCPSSWQDSGVPFTETDTHITFTVHHFSGYGGGLINVINVQSYPTLNGNWTVAFNTTGTENLTITATNGTQFITDLMFLELRCGNTILAPVYDGAKVFYENYSCNETGYETSKVVTTGKHTLKFEFGNSTAYAYNIVVNGTQPVTKYINTTFCSENGADSAGYATAVADLNNDNITDFLIGAMNRNESNRSYNGKVYLLYGPHKNNSQTNLSTANATWIGAQNFSFAGNALTTGDFNNDSFKDIVIGSYGDATSGFSRSGSVYVINGGLPFSGNSDLLTSYSSLFVGQTVGGNVGWAVAAGDLNGDGVDDLALSELEPFSGSGHVYVFFGPLPGGGLVSNADVILNGTTTTEHFGQVLAIGDLNNDTYHDLIIGADNFSLPPLPFPQSGAAFVFYGPLVENSSLNDTQANVTFLGENDGDRAGYSLSSHKDANNDSIDDLLVGAPLYDAGLSTDIGKAYLFFGNSSLNGTINLNLADVSWYGEAAYDYLGYSVLLSYEDNNTIADVVLGAPGNDYNVTNGGRAYFKYGPISAAAAANIGTSADGSLYGTVLNGSLGSSLASGSITISMTDYAVLFGTEPPITTTTYVCIFPTYFYTHDYIPEPPIPPIPPTPVITHGGGVYRGPKFEPPIIDPCITKNAFTTVDYATGKVSVTYTLPPGFDMTRVMVAIFSGATSWSSNLRGSSTKVGTDTYRAEFVPPKDVLQNEKFFEYVITDEYGRTCGSGYEAVNPCAVKEPVQRGQLKGDDFWDYLAVDYTTEDSKELLYLDPDFNVVYKKNTGVGTLLPTREDSFDNAVKPVEITVQYCDMNGDLQKITKPVENIWNGAYGRVPAETFCAEIATKVAAQMIDINGMIDAAAAGSSGSTPTGASALGAITGAAAVDEEKSMQAKVAEFDVPAELQELYIKLLEEYKIDVSDQEQFRINFSEIHFFAIKRLLEATIGNNLSVANMHKQYTKNLALAFDYEIKKGEEKIVYFRQEFDLRNMEVVKDIFILEQNYKDFGLDPKFEEINLELQKGLGVSKKPEKEEKPAEGKSWESPREKELLEEKLLRKQCQLRQKLLLLAPQHPMLLPRP